MKAQSDPLGKYVVGIAWFFLILGVLMLPFPFVAQGPFAERIETYPDFIQNVFFVYYAVFGVIGGVFGVLLYPIGFFIPAVIYLSRFFRPVPRDMRRSAFVLLVLLFFSGIVVMLFRTPFNIV